MSKLPYVVFLILSFAPFSLTIGQEDLPSFSLTPFVSVETFSPAADLGTCFMFGMAASYSLSSTVHLEISAQTGSTSEGYDLVGRTGSLAVHHTQYRLQVDYLVMHLPGVADLSAAAGFGLSRLSIEEQRVSLGALGQVSIPARSETRELSSVGLILSKSFSSALAVRLEPQLILLSPFSDPQSNYMISGGVTFVIL